MAKYPHAHPEMSCTSICIRRTMLKSSIYDASDSRSGSVCLSFQRAKNAVALSSHFRNPKSCLVIRGEKEKKGEENKHVEVEVAHFSPFCLFATF